MISVAELQTWLDVTGDDAVITAIRDGVIALLERETDRSFLSPPGSLVEVLDGGDNRSGRLLELRSTDPETPLILKEEPNGGALTTVRFRDRMADPWVDQALSDFEVAGRLVYRLSTQFPAGRRNVQITYPFGYAENDGPSDADLVIRKLVQYCYEKRDTGSVKSTRIGGHSVTLGDIRSSGLDMEVAALRRPSLPV